MIIKHISKDSGIEYEVDTVNLTCNCPNYEIVQRKIGGLCKHLEDELDVDKFKERVLEMLNFINDNNDAVQFVDNFSEEDLQMLKKRGDVFEQTGMIVRL